jgi:hypothetical protein
MNETQLIVGSEQGRLFYYKEIYYNLAGEFAENDSLYLIINNQAFEIFNGIRTSAAIQDINNDGFPDLFAGNYSGGLNFFSGQNPPPVIGFSKNNVSDFEIKLYPNPAKDYIKVELELQSGHGTFHLKIYNIYAEVVYSKIIIANEEATISLKNLPAGIYICRIEICKENNCSIFKRFIISN